jgi:hypothetical protein
MGKGTRDERIDSADGTLSTKRKSAWWMGRRQFVPARNEAIEALFALRLDGESSLIAKYLWRIRRYLFQAGAKAEDIGTSEDELYRLPQECLLRNVGNQIRERLAMDWYGGGADIQKDITREILAAAQEPTKWMRR